MVIVQPFSSYEELLQAAPSSSTAVPRAMSPIHRRMPVPPSCSQGRVSGTTGETWGRLALAGRPGGTSTLVHRDLRLPHILVPGSYTVAPCPPPPTRPSGATCTTRSSP